MTLPTLRPFTFLSLPNSSSSSSRLYLQLFLLSSLWLAVNAVDWFSLFDSNHDGSISKDEYQQGMSKLQSRLEGPVPPSFLESLDISKGFWKAFSSSVAMIIATEIGDKTFFIAAVLSMRFDRSAVFAGAIIALIIMTVLSSLMGQVLPNVLPKKYTHILGGILFLYFGIKLILESTKMEANRVSEELEEVEEELHFSSKKAEGDEEAPKSGNLSVSQHSSSGKEKGKKSYWGVVWQSLTLTFLAEWGDRSQIATIALAAAKNPYGVTLGGCVGHSLCTGLAVIGGRMLAARISEKSVAFYGGIIFLIFGIHSLFFES